MDNNQVYIEECLNYDINNVRNALQNFRHLFKKNINKGNTVILKPNWLAESHKYKSDEWESLITHPSIITAVLEIVIECLNGSGKVIIADSPQTNSSWVKIMERMTTEIWFQMGKNEGISIEIIDLRDAEWKTKGGVTVSRRQLKGDPAGSVIFNLKENSEFVNHKRSKRGYFGADYDKEETNRCHSNGNHFYKVSRSVINSDVFINIPKLKTHKKAGITCSLKNLVGINTHKNWLPHHNEGTPDEGGDQFPEAIVKNKLEVILLEKFVKILSRNHYIGSLFIPIKKMGEFFFGKTQNTIRSGSWYGNDTLWRMILDLNKILLYANTDGTLRNSISENRKKYITVVDAVISGEGKGPEAPDPKHTGTLIAGTNAVAVDSACAKLMGFDWLKIPSIKNAYSIKSFPLCNFSHKEIHVISSKKKYDKFLNQVNKSDLFHFEPHFGWRDHIERDPNF